MRDSSENQKSHGFSPQKSFHENTLNNFKVELPESKKKRNFELASLSQIENDPLHAVYDAYTDLDKNIDKIDKKIMDVIQRQNNDYFSAYKFEMEQIQQELLEMKRKYETFMRRAGTGAEMSKLQTDLRFFEEQAKDLQKVVEEKDRTINNLRTKVSMIEGERSFLKEYILTNIRRNKIVRIDRVSPIRLGGRDLSLNQQILSPDDSSKKISPRFSKENPPSALRNKKLNSIIRNDIKTEGDINEPNSVQKVKKFLNQIKHEDWNDKDLVLTEIAEFNLRASEEFEQRLRRVKHKFEKDTVKIKAIYNEKLLEQNNLLSFFRECVEKVRSSILYRKSITKKPTQTNLSSMLINQYFKPEEFLLSDKQKILEYFIENEYVYRTFEGMMSNNVTFSKDKGTPMELSHEYDPTETSSQYNYLKSNKLDVSDFLELDPITKSEIAQTKFSTGLPTLPDEKILGKPGVKIFKRSGKFEKMRYPKDMSKSYDLSQYN